MSDSTTTRVGVIPWFFIYVILKFAGVGAFVPWSWWWVFLPIVPVVVELFKAITG